MTDRQDFQEFEARAKLPARASRDQLSNLGGRYLRTDNFNHKGATHRLEQMQLQKPDGYMYMWKRLGPQEGINDKLFEIHLEIRPDGYNRYETIEA